MNKFLYRTLLILFFISTTPFAHADFTIEFKDDAKGKINKILIKGQKVRFMGDVDGNLIYDAKLQSLFTLNEKEKSYGVVDKTMLKKISAQMEAIKKQMEAQLADLPKEQRDQAMKMMEGTGKKGAGGHFGLEPEPVRYVETGKKKKVKGYSCRVVQEFEGDTLSSEACVTHYSTLGMSDKDFSVLKSLSDFMVEISGGQSSGLLVYKSDIPVLYKDFDEEDKSSGTIQKASGGTVDKTLFEIPKGYRKIEMSGFDLDQ